MRKIPPAFSRSLSGIFLVMAGLPFSGLAAVTWPGSKKSLTAFRLDFDDAYQYVAAEKFDLALVSFDADFDRTDRKRMVPAEIR